MKHKIKYILYRNNAYYRIQNKEMLLRHEQGEDIYRCSLYWWDEEKFLRSKSVRFSELILITENQKYDYPEYFI